LLKGLVFDIKRYSIHDGPGIRTTIFFKGCPLSCWWCHNPEGQAPTVEVIFRQNRCIRCGACLVACEQGAISWDGAEPLTDREKCARCGACVAACYAEARQCVGRALTVTQVMAEAQRDTAFYDESGGGVTLSGGEPLWQPDFALPLLQACKRQEMHTAVDTCGFAPWEAIDRLREYTDLFMYDLKLLDDVRHRQFTGVSNSLILQNLQVLSQRGHHIVLRVPVIPGINDDDESIRQIGAFAAALPHLDGVDLLPYHHIGVDKYVRLDRTYRLPETRPPSDERMAEMAHLLRQFGLSVRVGG
jgi:pyruvate formate lyase activating enzyme